jgi:hypothetical protein
MWQTQSNYCAANGISGPTAGLHYAGQMPGSWTGVNAIPSYTAWLKTIAPFVRPGTYMISTNEILGNQSALNSDPVLSALGGTG